MRVTIKVEELVPFEEPTKYARSNPYELLCVTIEVPGAEAAGDMAHALLQTLLNETKP